MIKQIALFAMAIASRGLNNKKIDLPTKQLRYVSCFGFHEIPQCPKLKKSNHSENHYCSGCGCGDHEHTWLHRTDGKYSKLDYPNLTCPMKMPGFTNYDPNDPIEANERKRLIENLEPEKLKFVNITISVDEEKEKILEQIDLLRKT